MYNQISSSKIGSLLIDDSQIPATSVNALKHLKLPPESHVTKLPRRVRNVKKLPRRVRNIKKLPRRVRAARVLGSFARQFRRKPVLPQAV